MYRARTGAFALISVVALSAAVFAPGAAGSAASPALSRAAAVRAAAVPSPSMTATPDAGLTQDEGVDVNGFGFIPDGFVILEWCPTHGGFCRYNLTTRADADGNFADLMRAEFRTSTSAGAPSDCNVEGCVARATEVVGGQSASASVPVAFDPNQAAVPPISVTAAPAAGLHDLDTVHVTGIGFSTSVTVNQCAITAGVCLSNFTEVDASSGSFATDLRARRFIGRVGGPPVDCVTIACVLITEGLSGSTDVITSPLAFTASPVPAIATVNVTPNSNLPFDAPVAITGANFPPSSSVTVEQCPRDLLPCLTLGTTTADTLGVVALSPTLHRLINSSIDCTTVSCFVVLRGEFGDLASAPVTFDPTTALPSMTVDPSTNLAYRDVVSVKGANLRAGGSYVASQCYPTGPVSLPCSAVSGTADSTGSIDLALPVRRRSFSFDIRGIQTYDCAAPATCEVSLAPAEDGSDPLRAAISFDPSMPAPPSLSASPNLGLGADSVVTVTGSGYQPNTQVRLEQCTRAIGGFERPRGCSPGFFTQSDASGAINTIARVQRFIGEGLDVPIDCAAAADTCVLRAGSADIFLQDPFEIGTASLGFGSTPTGPTPEISIEGTTVTEGTGATTDAVATIRLSEPTDHTVRVQWRTESGTAREDLDYSSRSGEATFVPGTTEAVVTVPIIGDTLDEPKERFGIRLSAPVNGVIVDDHATVKIRDDDSAPTVTVDDVRVSEDGGVAHVPVRLSTASGRNVTVEFVTHHRSARSRRDYVRVRGTVVIPAGTVDATADVSIVDDTRPEKIESFRVEFDDAEHARLAQDTATVTILDND